MNTLFKSYNKYTTLSSLNPLNKLKNLTSFSSLPKYNFSVDNSNHCTYKSSNQVATIRQPAPHFESMAYVNGDFKKVSLKDYTGKWVVLFFYPLDNTFVCPTEIVSFSDNSAKFEENNCSVISCSIDSKFSHKQWANMPRSEGGLSPMKIPMLEDLSQTISYKYGVRINEENDEMRGVSLRGTFIIDDKGILRHSCVNDLPVGRNVDEVLRTLKAFQHVAKHGEVCPANWDQGKKAMNVGSSEKLNEFWKKEHAKH